MSARQGPSRASEQGVMNSNDAARLRTGQTGADDSNRRVNRQGPANASDRGVQQSNENAGLRDSTTGAVERGNRGRGGGDLDALLRDGLQIRNPGTGAVVATVLNLVRDADGDVTAVVVRLADGTTRTIDADDISITDGQATLNLSQLGSPPTGSEALAARLQQGLDVFDPSGNLLGRIEQLTTTGNGNVRSVVVQVRNGARRFLRTVPIEDVSLAPDGRIVVRIGS
jgi:hypothetical protein